MSERDTFLESLTFADLKKEYLEQEKVKLQQLKKKHEAQHQESVQMKLKGIEEDKKHRMILNACIFPFSQEEYLTKLGYYFVRASPLSELGISNVDFLIHCSSKIISNNFKAGIYLIRCLVRSFHSYSKPNNSAS